MDRNFLAALAVLALFAAGTLYLLDAAHERQAADLRKQRSDYERQLAELRGLLEEAQREAAARRAVDLTRQRTLAEERAAAKR